jgi:hypothetical protein
VDAVVRRLSRADHVEPGHHHPSGTALGGDAAFDLVHDGSYRFRGHMHDSGATDYDFRVRATVASGEGLVLTAQKGGDVEGSESFPDPNRTLSWDDSSTAKLRLEIGGRFDGPVPPACHLVFFAWPDPSTTSRSGAQDRT